MALSHTLRQLQVTMLTLEGLLGIILGIHKIKSTHRIASTTAQSHTHNRTTTNKMYLWRNLGSVSGTSNLENCVSTGKIMTITQCETNNNYTGSVVGKIYTDSLASIMHCYWTSDVSCNNACGSGSLTVKEAMEVELNTTTTVSDLNSYAANRSWNKWLLNINSKTVTFKSNNCNDFNLSSQLILIPSLVESENHTFSGWFEDEGCTREFTSSYVRLR